MGEGFVQSYVAMRCQPMRACHLTILGMHVIRDLDSCIYIKAVAEREGTYSCLLMLCQ